MSKSSRPSRSASSPLPTGQFEPLENRRLLSVTTIVGTAGDDKYVLNNLKAGDTVIFDGKGGHDLIQIFAGNGTKTGNGYGDGSSVAGTVKLLSSNGGAWDLEVSAMATTADHQIVAAAGKLTGAVAGTIDYSQAKLDGLGVAVGSRTRSTASIREAVASYFNDFQLFGNWDADVGNSTGKVDAFKGPVQVSAQYGTGTSTLYVNSAADTAKRTITLDGHNVSGMLAKPFGYSGFDNATFVLGSGDKTILAKRSLTATTFVSTGGHDTVIVGNNGSIQGLERNVKFFEFGSTTTATIDASADTSPRSWSIDKVRVRASGVQGDVKFYGNPALTVLTGKGKDAVDVASTAAKDFTLKTGAGDDHVRLFSAGGKVIVDGGEIVEVGTQYSTGGDLSKFAKGVEVRGAWSVSFSDAWSTAAHRYQLTPTGLNRDGVERFSYGSAAVSVGVLGGSADDVLDAYAATNVKSVNLAGMGGNDKIYGSRTTGQLDGGAGNDTIIAYGNSPRIYGEDGNDVINVANCTGTPNVSGGKGYDTLRYGVAVTQDGIESAFRASSVNGTIFSDTNKNGIRDAGEAGLAGVQIWVDVNHSGTFDYGDLAAFTDASGSYSIKDISNGSYIVSAIPPFGSYQTTAGGQPYSFSTSGGATLIGRDFGVARK